MRRNRTDRRGDVIAGERDMVDTGARGCRDESPSCGFPAFGNVQRKPNAAFRTNHGAAPDEAVGVRQLPQWLRHEAEHGAPKQNKSFHPTMRQRVRDVVDREQPCSRVRARL